MSRRPVRFADLGSWSYQRAWDFQESIFTEVVERKSANRKLSEEERIATHDTLLFVEHPHVYTLGKSGDFGNLLADDDRLKSIGAEFYRTNRGGDITYHGPGQLVGYPILDLDEYFTDIHRYLRTLEEVIIATLADYGLSGDRSPGETGVWLDVGTPLCPQNLRNGRARFALGDHARLGLQPQHRLALLRVHYSVRNQGQSRDFAPA